MIKAEQMMVKSETFDSKMSQRHTYSILFPTVPKTNEGKNMLKHAYY